MASSGNFCTFNPLSTTRTDITYEVGNTSMKTATATEANVAGTHGMTSGKFYWEAYPTGGSAHNVYPIGIYDFANGDFMDKLNSTYAGQSGRGPMFVIYSGSTYLQKIKSDGTFTDTDVSGGSGLYQIALDLDNNKVWFGKDNTWADSGDPANGSNPAFTGGDLDGDTGRTWMPFSGTFRTSTHAHYRQNWGQDSTFGGLISAGGNADGNGFGDFKYAPPTGFLALCSGNLSVSDDIDPAQTDDDYPSKQFNVVTYTGNSSTNAVTGLNLQPDLLWVKKISATGTNYLSDTSRGINKFLFSNGTDAEQTGGGYASIYSSFDSDGFTLGSSATGPNDSGATYVAWGWKAGGSASSDASGDITVNRSTNDKSKFSILTYTGNGSSGSTIAHGLGVKPAMTIIKERGAANGWNVWHQGNNNGDYDSFGELNSSGSWNQNQGSNGPYTADPTTSLLTLSAYGQVNNSSDTYVCYAWADVEGMQKFGSFEGNANNDGPFVYTGFRPRMLFIKNTESASPWCVYDGARPGFNPSYLVGWDETTAQNTSSYPIDILSNGFKLRTSNATINSAHTWVFGAWGDVPFKYNNTF